jgi:hypothetical protein
MAEILEFLIHKRAIGQKKRSLLAACHSLDRSYLANQGLAGAGRRYNE